MADDSYALDYPRIARRDHQGRPFPLNALLVIVLWPWVIWLGGFRGDDAIVTIAFAAAVFSISAAFVVDGELRREASLFHISVIPIVIGLWFLPIQVVLGSQLAAGVLVIAVASRRAATDFAASFVIAWSATAVLGVALDQVQAFEQGDRRAWTIVAVFVVLADIACTWVDAAVRSKARSDHRWPTRHEQLGAFGQVVVQCAIACTSVVLIRSESETALLVAVSTVGTFAVVRRNLAVSARNRQLNRLNQFAMRLTAAERDETVFHEMLLETEQATGTQRCWMIMVRPSASRRYVVEHTTLRSSPIFELDHMLTGLLETNAARRIVATDRDVARPLREQLAVHGFAEAILVSFPGPQDSRYVLVVADRGEDFGRFDDDDMRTVRAITEHARLALHNVDLLAQTKAQAAEQEYLAHHDPLTDLPNRMMLHHALNEALRDGDPVGVLLLDLDRFREVNDTLGHVVGDLVVMEVSRRVRRLIGVNELAARLGGDEWAIICRPNRELDDDDVLVAIRAKATLVIEALAEPFHIEDIAIDIRGSVGVAIAGEQASDSNALLRHADVAMYLAKESRTNIEVYHHDRDHHSPRRLALAGQLRHAIANEALHLHYQPQVRLADDSPYGVEALVRWRQSDGSVVSPDEFIYVAEHTGLIHGLTEQVISQAVQRAAHWHSMQREMRVSMNLSAHNLRDESIIDHLAKLLGTYRVPPSMLLVELTESAVIEDEQHGIAMMHRLRELGLGLAIDDFGTGQSSLAYLTKVPATELKIDRSFVSAMEHDDNAQVVVRSTIRLAHSLGMYVVAEGVETVSQRDLLKTMGCDIAQGYLYSRPLEARGVELWMDDLSTGGFGITPEALRLGP